jgi:hypothetical protein
MSSANETAEAILIVIKRLLKWILLSGVAIGVVIYLLVQIVEYWEWYTTGRHKEQVEIDFHVAKLNDCDKEYPYLYIVRNNSDKTIDETEFTVEIRNKGYSSALNSYTSITESKILKQNEATAGCFKAERKDNNGYVLEKEVDFDVTYKGVKFKK